MYNIIGYETLVEEFYSPCLIDVSVLSWNYLGVAVTVW